MNEPVADYEKFTIYEFKLENGQSRVNPMKYFALDGSLPEDERQRMQALHGDGYFFIPIRTIGTLTEGEVTSPETGRNLRPGRDVGPCLVVDKPVQAYTQTSIGPSTYVCVSPKDNYFYHRELIHNHDVSGVPDPQFYPEAKDEVTIPAYEDDQYLVVASGTIALPSGSFKKNSLLCIPGGSGSRRVALTSPDTSVFRIWR